MANSVEEVGGGGRDAWMGQELDFRQMLGGRGLDRGPNDLAEIDRRERNQSQNQLLSQNQSQSHRQWVLVVWYVRTMLGGGGPRGVGRP